MNNIIVGRKPVMEALRAGTSIEQVVFLLGVQGKVIEEIKAMAERHHVQVTQVSKQQFRKLAIDATTQGVVAVIPSRKYVGLEQILHIVDERNEPGFIVILDEIEDPHNLGAILRTAECAGAHGVILPKHHAASVTSTVIKTSAGATEHMAMAEVPNIVNSIEELKTKGYWVVGLDMEGEKLYTAVDYKTPITIIVGNEGKGIRRLVKDHCDHRVRIPLYGKLDSLNASVACALVMYEVAKQRRSEEGR
jgi:23S rRNA (guanosine2251-2'-O)-methyltransferase